MARARRVENGRSSSTINRLLSARSSNASGASAIRTSPCMSPNSCTHNSDGWISHMGIVALVRESSLPVGLRRNCRTSFKRLAKPNDPRDRARFRETRIGQGQLRARALQQCLGDEEPEAQSAAFLAVLDAVRRAARGDIGLADTQQDVGRIARPVIPDLDDDVAIRPMRLEADAAFGEIRRVVEDVGQAVDHARDCAGPSAPGPPRRS